MIKDIVVYTVCGHCKEGSHLKEYKELEVNSDGVQVLVDKVGTTHVYFELEPEKLEHKTIAEIIKGKMCRKCQRKSLKELVK